MDDTTIGGGDTGGASDIGGGGDLKSAIEQLQQSIAQISTQIEAVASAAGVSGQAEGSPEEEGAETPTEESAEPQEASPAVGGNKSMAAFMSKPKMRM
jgi:hypothetical protein